MPVQPLLRVLREPRRNDRQTICPEFRRLFAQRDSLFCGNTAGADVDRHTVRRLLKNDAHDLHLFREVHRVVFSVGAKGKNAMQPGTDQTIDLFAELRLVERLVSKEWGRHSCNNSFGSDHTTSPFKPACLRAVK